MGKPFMAAQSALINGEQKELEKEEAQPEKEDKRGDQERPLVEIENVKRETSIN
jgi:hypothetical protein